MATLVLSLSLSREASTEGRSEPGLGGLCSVASPGGPASREETGPGSMTETRERDERDSRERHSVNIIYYAYTLALHTGAPGGLN